MLMIIAPFQNKLPLDYSSTTQTNNNVKIPTLKIHEGSTAQLIYLNPRQGRKDWERGEGKVLAYFSLLISPKKIFFLGICIS